LTESETATPGKLGCAFAKDATAACSRVAGGGAPVVAPADEATVSPATTARATQTDRTDLPACSRRRATSLGTDPPVLDQGKLLTPAFGARARGSLHYESIEAGRGA